VRTRSRGHIYEERGSGRGWQGERGGMSGDSVRGCEVRYPRSGWEGKRGNSVGHRTCMCGHWQGGGEMGCRRWLGFEGGAGVVGQGGSEGIVQV